MNVKAFVQDPKAILEVSRKHPFYVAGGLLLMLLLADYFGILRFQLSTLMSLNPEITRLSRDLETARNDIQRMPQYQKEVKDRKDEITEINRKINSREEVPLLLEDVSRIANQNNVRIERIMPDTSIEEPVLQNNAGQYFSIPIIVEASSGYHDFARFLNQLEADGVFLDLPEFTIATNKNDSVSHIIQLTLDTIVFEEAEDK